MLVRALTNPVYSYRKVRQYGFGRIVNDIAKKFPDGVRWHVRKGVRAAKIG